MSTNWRLSEENFRFKALKGFSATYSLTLQLNSDMMKSPYMTDGMSGIDHVKYKSIEPTVWAEKEARRPAFYMVQE